MDLNDAEAAALQFMKAKKPDRPRIDIEMQMLSKLPGVSTVTAKLLLNTYTFPEIIRGLSVDQLKEIRYSTGSSLKSPTIKKLTTPACVKDKSHLILAVIKGVSIDTATLICNTHCIHDIMAGTVSEKDISDIPNVGASVAKKVVNFLRSPHGAV